MLITNLQQTEYFKDEARRKMDLSYKNTCYLWSLVNFPQPGKVAVHEGRAHLKRASTKSWINTDKEGKTRLYKEGWKRSANMPESAITSKSSTK